MGLDHAAARAQQGAYYMVATARLLGSQGTAKQGTGQKAVSNECLALLLGWFNFGNFSCIRSQSQLSE